MYVADRSLTDGLISITPESFFFLNQALYVMKESSWCRCNPSWYLDSINKAINSYYIFNIVFLNIQLIFI